MTATSESQRTKRSKGFTIDCIMGTDTDSQTDKRVPSPDHSDGEVSPVVRSSRGHTSADRDHVRESESDRFPTHSNERTHEHSHGHSESDRLQPSELSSLSSKYLPHRTSTSLHSDAIRDINFSSANIREGIRAATSPDALKHFHEAFIQSAGATNGGVGVPTLGHFDAQRHFRHPLSTMGVSGYPGHPMTSHAQVHPMLLNGIRDLRHMYPYIADRYPNYLMPRYGMGGVPGLFFQPYRKPKRIRTAFSPSQLLQLEKSFEKSHYVVGQERKDLANELQLSETQVKVWFQNRRTKYKRTKSEHDEGGSSNEGHDTSHCQDSNDESDISDIDDIDDVGDTYNPAHAYHNPIQTC